MNIIKSFFIEEDLKSILGWLGINYKKAMKNRIILSCFFGIATLALGIYLKSIYLMVGSVFVGIGYYKFQYVSVKKKRKNQVAIKRRMFPAFVKKMLILIRTNNVYTSLIKMIDYTDEPIKGYIKELIEEIKVDKTIAPYNNFASKMEFIEAYQIMGMLYTFSEHAMNRKHLISLETMISNLYDNEIDEVVEGKKRLLWLYPNFCILGMLGLVFSLALYMFITVLSEVGIG